MMRWRVILILASSAAVLSVLAYAFAFEIGSALAFIADCRNEYVGCTVLYDYQALVAGLLALLAALIGARAIRRVNYQEEKRQRLAALRHYLAAASTSSDLFNKKETKFPKSYFPTLAKATEGLRVVDSEMAWMGLSLFYQAQIDAESSNHARKSANMAIRFHAAQLITVAMIAKTDRGDFTPLKSGDVPSGEIREKLTEAGIPAKALEGLEQYFS